MISSPAKVVRGPKQTRRRATRKAILSAAEVAFATCGLAGARTDEIAAQAGVNKALLYYYFQSKDRLYEAVLEEHFREFNQQAMEILQAQGSPSTLLLRYVSMHFDFISEKHRHVALHQQLMTTGGKPLERLVKHYVAPRSKALGDLLDRGMGEGEFRTMDRMHLAVSIVALIVFYFSAAHVLRLLGHVDAYSATQLQIRKAEVLNFIRHAVFLDSEAT